MRKINEIFYSLQGEGFHTGTPAVFVRFSGCNLRCSFCDTRHEEGVMMTDEEIVEKVSSFPARIVILTGGEPSLWIDKALISRLREAGKQICIETNGTRPLPDGIDWVTCSPKDAPWNIDRIDELKIVYQGQDVEQIASLLPSPRCFLQPCSGLNVAETVEYIKSHPQWRLSLQTHRLIDIP